MSVRRLKIVGLAMLLCFSSTGTNALGPPFNALGGIGGSQKKCEPSVTTASGDYVNHKGGVKGPFCSGDLIFEDTFDTFDTQKWQHENTLAGGGVSAGRKYNAMFVLKCVFYINPELGVPVVHK